MSLHSITVFAVFAGLVLLTSAQYFQPSYRCQLPKPTARCFDSRPMPRYYFNYQLGICEKFIYRGCGGSSNNFHTLTECRAVCGGEDLCLQPVLQGHCQGYYPRFFYDRQSGICRRFAYGGCGGNCNNFHTRQDCEFQCC